MTDIKDTEQVTRILFNAITNAVAQIQEEGLQDAVSHVGPVLLTTGTMILVQGSGMEQTAAVLKELANRVECGDFTGIDSLIPTEANS